MNFSRKIRPSPKRATNVSLSSGLIELARELDINISSACESGLEAEVAAARRRKWQEENREAIEFWNDYVGKHGLPLGKYRQF